MHLMSRRLALQSLGCSLLAPSLTAAADPYADAVFQDGPPPPVARDAFTMVVLSDTQNDCEKHPATFVAQIRWALDHKADRRIAALLQLGDITRITHAYHGSARLLPMDRACH